MELIEPTLKNNLVKIRINFYNKKFKLPFSTNTLESEVT